MAEGPFGRSTEHPKYGSHLMQEAITNVDPQLSKSVVILASVARQIHRRPLPPIPQLMPVSGERVAPRGWSWRGYRGRLRRWLGLPPRSVAEARRQSRRAAQPPAV